MEGTEFNNRILSEITRALSTLFVCGVDTKANLCSTPRALVISDRIRLLNSVPRSEYIWLGTPWTTIWSYVNFSATVAAPLSLRGWTQRYLEKASMTVMMYLDSPAGLNGPMRSRYHLSFTLLADRSSGSPSF